MSAAKTPADLRDALRDWRTVMVVAAAVEAGLIDVLSAQPVSSAQITERCGCNARAVRIVLQALHGLGYVERQGERYALVPAARRLLADPSDEEYALHPILHQYWMMTRWIGLPHIVRPDAPPTESAAHFIGAMAAGAERSAHQIADLVLARWPSARSVLDVGGGPGVHAREFIRRGLTATLLDRPEVIALGQPQWRGQPGITLEGGDFNLALPAGPFDLAFLGSVCHIYGPDESRALFRRVYGALASGGGIAVADFVLGMSPAAPMFAVNMLASTERGGTWTRDEYESWLAGSGFVRAQVLDLEGGVRQLILAEKA